MLVEALLLAHQFHSHHNLSRTLDTLLTATDELFNNQISVDGEGESRTVTILKGCVLDQPVVPLGLGLLEAIVSTGQRYMAEFERLGVLQGSGGGGRGGGGGGGGGRGPLADQSMVLSDISEGARASLRLRASSVDQASNDYT